MCDVRTLKKEEKTHEERILSLVEAPHIFSGCLKRVQTNLSPPAQPRSRLKCLHLGTLFSPSPSQGGGSCWFGLAVRALRLVEASRQGPGSIPLRFTCLFNSLRTMGTGLWLVSNHDALRPHKPYGLLGTGKSCGFAVSS